MKINNLKVTRKSILILASVFFISFTLASQIGMNYYTTSNNYLDLSAGVNKTFQFKFILDDMGAFVSQPVVADIDNDGTQEIIFPEYSGFIQIWNWTGMKTGKYEARDTTDRGTIYLTTFYNQSIGHDNDGDGYLEIAFNDYNGYLRVVEYNGTNINLVYNEPADRGNYMNSPVWCDIDEDGDYDIFTCAYDGYCRLYMYDSGTFSLNYTSGDLGTGHYGNHPQCVNWSNSDWGYELIYPDYNGKVEFFHWNDTSNQLENIYETSDHGNIFGTPWVGELNENLSGVNYLAIPYTNGMTYLYNCSQAGCTNIDASPDIGGYSYGGVRYLARNISGKMYLFNSDSSSRVIMTYMDSGNTLNSVVVGEDFDAYSYTSIGMPRMNASNNWEYILHTSRYNAMAIMKQDAWNDWNFDSFVKNVERERFNPNSYAYGFLYIAGWTCHDFTGDGIDECFIPSYLGHTYVFTYENITEYSTEFHDDYELSLLDIMPRDAVQYQVGNRTYCVNENENVLLYGLGGGKITKWIDAIDDDGSAISNEQRITDGILSTGTYFDTQTSSDYTLFDSGDEQGFRLNLTKLPQLGKINYVFYFSDGRDPADLSVEISNTTCTQPDTNIYTAVFDEQEGASNTDISGSTTHLGLDVRFLPQIVGCIRINSSGSYSNLNTYNSANVITEVSAYYANDCTFYHVPVDVRGAIVTGEYNHSLGIQRMKYEISPNQFERDSFGLIKDFTSGLVDVINRWILARV